MPAERILGRRRQIERVRQCDAARRQAKLAQQPPDAEEHAAGIVADDRDDGRGIVGDDGLDAKAVRFLARGLRGNELPIRVRKRVEQPRRPDRDDRHARCRPANHRVPANPRSPLHLFDKNLDGLGLGRREPVRHDDDRTGQVDFAGPETAWAFHDRERDHRTGEYPE